jgi:hypothetical protein
MRREFLKKLQARPELESLVVLEAADAAAFDFGRTMQAAMMSGTFDHLLDDDARLRALTNIARHLDVNGTFVFDVFLGLMGDSELRPAGEVSTGGVVYRRMVGRSVVAADKVEVMLVFEKLRSGKVIERIEEHSVAAITDRALVCSLLRAAGFKLAGEFGGYNRSQFQIGGELLIVEAVKE